jgi:xanthine/uracil permease
MIGLLGAKIWKENGVDFGNPINLVPVAAGIIIAIGNTTLVITDNFQISGIALGTIVTVAAFHLVRLIAPPYLQEELRREGTGRPGEGGEGAAIIIDEPGAYKEP